LDNAAFLRNTYANDKEAARVLDLALQRFPSAAPLAWAMRAELAVAMGEMAQADAFQQEVAAIPLSDAERAQYRTELGAAAALMAWIGL
jgi:hypothetical protein